MHASGAVNVMVTNSDGTTGTKTSAFTYGSPTVTAIAPSSGPLAGGTNVTITLKLYSQYIIHKDARFLIEQSGFLGDQYVGIMPTYWSPKKPDCKNRASL